MLPVFRRKKNWLRWILLLGIIALGFTTVFLFVNTPTGLTGGPGQQEVATVAGQGISAVEFRRQYQQMFNVYRQMYNLDRQNPEIIRQLGIGQQALNQLISEYAIWHEAGDFGLTVTPEELVEEITRFPVFNENGRFIGQERYQQILRANNMTVPGFEEAVRRDILRRKFRNIVTDGVLATPQEVRQEFLNSNQQVRIRYVAFDSKATADEPVDEAELESFFEENQEDYRQEEERKIQYLTVAVEPENVEVSEQQVQAEMASVSSDEQVRARHILIRADSPEEEEAAREEAEALLEQIRNGANFEELARQHSDDDVSAARGGDLGFFSRGDMVPEFESAAFALEPGQVTDVVQTAFGYHIIQTLEKKSDSEESIRQAAEYEARKKKAEREARSRAQQISSELGAGTSLEEVAQKNSLEVSETPYFSQSQPVPEIGGGEDFKSAIFSLQENEITEPFPVDSRFVIARLQDIKPAEIPPLDQVRDQVVEDYKAERGDRLARERAFEFFSEAREAKSLSSTAKKSKLDVTTTEFFSRGSTIDETLKFSPEVHDQAFTMDAGHINAPVRVTDQYVVFEVAEKSQVDETQFSQEENQIAERLTDQKRSQFFSAYIQNIIERLRKENQIQINQSLVDELTG